MEGISKTKRYVEKAKAAYDRRTESYDRAMERRSAHVKKTDERLAAIREKKDDAVLRSISARREEREERVRKLYDDARIREMNRLKRKEGLSAREITVGRIKMAAVFCVTIICAAGMWLFVSGSEDKKASKDRNAAVVPVESETAVKHKDKTEKAESGKRYDSLDGITEAQLLWDVLMEHFDGNETAVLGVMCNLKAESKFEADNLEDYNNEIWEIDDSEYTEKVNINTIKKLDFLQSRHDDSTNGYYNEYDQWVNLDGGYGYVQVTSYEKKNDLYQFAEKWFSPGGKGADYRFNIGDPRMQANYVIRLLESDEYSDMDEFIRNSETVVDACYYWLKMYEIPYDPYCDDYYTLAFDRADWAEEIRKQVKSE